MMGMEIKRYIEVSEKLRRMLEDAEKQAKEIIAEAEARAERIIAEAREEARNLRLRAETGEALDEIVKEAEEKAKEEAEKVLKEYDKKVSTLGEIPEERFREAVELILKEVLP